MFIQWLHRVALIQVGSTALVLGIAAASYYYLYEIKG
jgi:flagellar biogenesis protein FliO